jgi:hypothetical protein
MAWSRRGQVCARRLITTGDLDLNLGASELAGVLMRGVLLVETIVAVVYVRVVV